VEPSAWKEAIVVLGCKGAERYVDLCGSNSTIVWVKIMGKKSTKIIQVPMEEELLKRIDTTAGIVAESRAAFIREACQQRLKSLHAMELDRLYVEGHQSHPENLDWAEGSAKLLSKRLPKEKW
jgi:hypothetical protein